MKSRRSRVPRRRRWRSPGANLALSLSQPRLQLLQNPLNLRLQGQQALYVRRRTRKTGGIRDRKKPPHQLHGRSRRKQALIRIWLVAFNWLQTVHFSLPYRFLPVLVIGRFGSSRFLENLQHIPTNQCAWLGRVMGRAGNAHRADGRRREALRVADSSGSLESALLAPQSTPGATAPHEIRMLLQKAAAAVPTP